MKSYFLLFTICITAASCNLFGDYGKKVEFGESEVYYKGDGVTEEDANKLGKFLKTQGYFDDKEKAVQITHDGTDYMLRFVIDEKKLTDPVRMIFWKFQYDIQQEVFKGKSTRIVLADQKLKDIEVLNPVAKHEIGESSIYYDNSEIKKSEVKALAGFLSEDAKLFTETNGAVGLYKKTNNVPVVYMIINTKSFKKTMLPEFSFWQEQMRDKVFDGEKAKIILINPDDFEQIAALPKLTEEERQAFLNQNNPANNTQDQTTQYTIDSTVTQTSSGILRLPNN